MQGSDGVVWEGPHLHLVDRFSPVVSKTHILLAQCREKALYENPDFKRFGSTWVTGPTLSQSLWPWRNWVLWVEVGGRSAD